MTGTPSTSLTSLVLAKIVLSLCGFRSKTSVQWSRNIWTRTNRFVFFLFYCDCTGMTGIYRLHFFSTLFPDTKQRLLCGEPFGVKLHLQHHLQFGLQHRLREFLTHHLINHECKSHPILPREQHRGVCHR